MIGAIFTDQETRWGSRTGDGRCDNPNEGL